MVLLRKGTIYWATLVILCGWEARASVWEGTFAASSAEYRESGEKSSGLSVRWRYRGYEPGTGGSGWVFSADWPGISALVGQHTVGYGIATRGDFSWEAAAGVSYSPIWSAGFSLIAGPSMKLRDGWVISLPLVLNSGIGLQATPYLGRSF